MRAAAAGDQAAWDAIVDRFQGLVWATARAHRLSRADAADVAQTTWLRLVEHLDRIREPERLGAWLATTARNECLRHIRLHGAGLPTDEADMFESPSTTGPSWLSSSASGTRRSGAGSAGSATAARRCSGSSSPVDEPSYEAVGAALDMPIGAIGPTRLRCLEKLRASCPLDPAFEGGVA